MNETNYVTIDGRIHTNFGTLINYQALGDVIDSSLVESVFYDMYEDKFDSPEEFIEFVKEHFNDEVLCECEYIESDSALYVTAECGGKEFTFCYWSDDIYYSIIETRGEEFLEEWDEFMGMYLYKMIDEMKHYTEPNF